MEKKYLDKYYPTPMSMEERLFEVGRNRTGVKFSTWVKTLVAGLIVSLFGYLLIGADSDTYEFGMFVFGIGDLIFVIGAIGIAIYCAGLRCLERAELLYNTRCAGGKVDYVPEVKKEKPNKKVVQVPVKEDYEVEEPMVSFDESPEAFIDEVLKTSTEDLECILREQQDLYTEPELKIIEEVLQKRKG